MESQRSMSGVWGSRDEIVCTLKRLRWLHPLRLLSPAAHKGALLDLIHSLHVASLSGHFIKTSPASWAPHYSSSVTFTSLHSGLSRPLRGMPDSDTLCVASTAIWSPCPKLPTSVLNHMGHPILFSGLRFTLTPAAGLLSLIPWASPLSSF